MQRAQSSKCFRPSVRHACLVHPGKTQESKDKYPPANRVASLTPCSGQFLETLGGLATIRAFGWQEDLIVRADERLDASQKPFYLLYSIQRWLNLVLDLIVAVVAIVLVAVAVSLRNTTSVGFTGVALFNIMTLSAALKSAISSWTLLETSIGAVARVKRFEESTPNENSADETQQPPADWPTTGAIVFDRVTATYKDDDADNSKPAISDLSLAVAHGEKIGICGRSGRYGPLIPVPY